MSWARSFNLISLQQGVAKLTPQPGHRELIKFVTQPRREQLAQLMQSVIGSPVRIEIEAAAPGAAMDADAEGPPRSGGRSSALEQAMSLPLVKQVMELFDAQVVDVRPESQAEEAPESIVEPATTEAPIAPPRPATKPPMRPVESFDDVDEEE